MVVAEHLGRLKLNGRVFGRARLSDVIELETLFVGITGKLSLWETLSLIGPRPDILSRALPPGVLRPCSSNGPLPEGGRPWYTSTISRSSALSPRCQW